MPYKFDLDDFDKKLLEKLVPKPQASSLQKLKEVARRHRKVRV